MKNLSIALGLAAFLGLAAGAALADGPAIGAAAPTFQLTTIDGKAFSLADAEKANKAVVLMFIATKCPYSNAYNDRMRDMAAAYARKGVLFVGINSNSSEPEDEVKAHAEQHGYTLHDRQGSGQQGRRPVRRPAHARGLRGRHGRQAPVPRPHRRELRGAAKVTSPGPEERPRRSSSRASRSPRPRPRRSAARSNVSRTGRRAAIRSQLRRAAAAALLVLTGAAAAAARRGFEARRRARREGFRRRRRRAEGPGRPRQLLGDLVRAVPRGVSRPRHASRRRIAERASPSSASRPTLAKDLPGVEKFLAKTNPDFPNYRKKSGGDDQDFIESVDAKWGGELPFTVLYVARRPEGEGPLRQAVLRRLREDGEGAAVAAARPGGS